MRLATLLTLCTATVVSAQALVGCSTSQSDVIQVYSARHYDLEQAFEAFHEETGIKVQFLFGSDTELRERIAAEGENSVADVYITVDAGNLAAAADQDIFTETKSETLDTAIPATLRDPQNRWFGLAKRVRTIVYSPARVSPDDLSTYADLADPKWKDRLCLRTANASYTQSLVASMIAQHGEPKTEQIVKGWAENGKIYSNDAEILKNIDSGSCDVGIVNHYYLARELKAGNNLEVKPFWADQEADGVHVNISGGGVVKGSDNPEGARKLLEWLATTGQEELVGDNLEYPANPDVKPATLLQGWGDFTEHNIDATAYATRNPDAIALMGRVGYQ